MKDFENIDRRKPFVETDLYVDQLVEKVTETAIRQNDKGRSSHTRMRVIVASAAAVVLIFLIGAGLFHFRQESPEVAEASATESPIDQFLGSISDEEAQMLSYYVVEEIPEY